jgi:hypothetical protein
MMLNLNQLCVLLFPYQTAVASRIALLFLKGERTGSPISVLAMRLPENITIMEESQRESGCLREKVRPPKNIA